jgi:hypothetical protein
VELVSLVNLGLGMLAKAITAMAMRASQLNQVAGLLLSQQWRVANGTLVWRRLSHTLEEDLS